MKLKTTADYPCPPHYLRRQRYETFADNWYNWETIVWSYDSTVESWADAEKFVAQRNGQSKMWEYKLPLHCERCYVTVHETYPLIGHGDMLGKHGCHKCHMEGLENMKQAKKIPGSNFTTNVIAPERKQGDIWKLPTVNSPMWTAQWGYQGSGKVPYIVSHKAKEPFLGNVTTEGWACSCPAFTRNTPRIPCKHCLGVMKKEGIASVWLNTATKVAVVDMGDADAQAFAQWKREQAAAKKECDAATAGGPKLKLAINTGRKFR